MVVYAARRATITASLTLSLASLLVGCSGDDTSRRGNVSSTSSASSARPSSTGDGGESEELVGVRATVVQQRIDEGTRRIGIQISVDAKTSLHVVGVQLRSAGFRPVLATGKDSMFAPGRVIDLVTTYGRALCEGQDPTEGLSAALTVEESAGSTRTYEVPVTGDGVGLVRRLHAAACAKLSLQQAASVAYTPFRRARVDGEEVLAGALEFERPDDADPGEVVTVDSLSGSVLFDFHPLRRTEPGFVARLETSTERLRLPVVIGSSGRCDQHARSQSTQTFLFSVYARVGSAVEHREIMIPPPLLQRQALALLDDVC